ncbi:BgTH12-03068 [Blumeria graminis f. sp. triticale]|uniref:tyrosinase n=1 Tax=Blumeria graminis f. sp. triticale TaxID=1689686 RepID=A0A9W4D314_BLUGR|nr:BgTH12-03068 [Blumeria graminis f. sp. triticale]
MITRFCAIALALNLCHGTNALSLAPTEKLDASRYIVRRQNPSLQSGSLPVRRNILEFQNDRVSWPLFIQALKRLQAKEESDPYSYFQLAGIHGRPYIGWNGDSKILGTNDLGYCVHNTVLFLPWHRPYMSMIEQLLVIEAQEVAKLYPDNTIYLEAAARLRFPYWDWAANPALPDIVNQPQIQIESWNGTQLVDNPLYEYKFQSPLDRDLFPSNSSDGWFAFYRHTVRGVNTRNPKEVSHPDVVNTSLQRGNLRANTWRALARSTTFNIFSSTSTPGSSIEAVHNTVHSAIGARYGHMSYLSYAAYDPLFWLHHANIDRLFALWQVLHPESFVQPEEDVFGNFITLPHTIVDVNTSLRPFREERSGEWWTSNSARYIDTFSYTYPELQGNRTSDQLKANVTAAINRLYQPTNSARKRFIRSSPGSTAAFLPTREWSLSVSVSKFDAGGANFRILVFLGQVPADPEEWELSEAFIGSISIFPPPYVPITAFDPFPEVITHSEVDLDEGLERYGMNVEDSSSVVEFLKEELQWRIQKTDGEVIPPENIPSLLMEVEEETVSWPTDVTELPSYGAKTSHPDAIGSMM